MKKSYFVEYFAHENSDVEMAVKAFDRIFRAYYNVFGGKRVMSGLAMDGEYHVRMEYFANWEIVAFFPDFYGLYLIFDKAMNRLDPDCKVGVDIIE